MKIQHKRSNVLDGGKAKEPTAGQMEYGELAVNYNTSDPSIFVKDSADNIVKIADAVPPGDGTITIKQPGSPDQSFTVNQDGDTEINLKNDNTQVTPGNGALSIESFGSGDTSTGSYTANQSGSGTVTLPQISYGDLKNKPTIPTPGAGVITVKQPGTADQSFNVNQTGPTEINLKNDNTVVTPGAGVITIKQPGVSDQSFNVNQAGPTEINLKNDNTVVTPGNGGLSIRSFGSGDTSTGTFTANQSGTGTVTLPQIDFGDLKNVPPAGAAPGNGTITITQPGTTDQTFTVNQNGDTTIALKNDNTQVTPGNGALTIKTAGEGANATGSFTANQGTGGTLTLPTIRYGDLSGRPSIPAPAGNGTITVTQPGTTNQTFTVNQSGNTTIALRNDNTVTTPGDGTITIVQPGVSDQTFTTNQSGNKTITLKNDNTVVTPGNGALTIRTAGEAATATGTFTANQSAGSTITLPTIRYGDLSGRPSIPAAAGNGTITIVQPGVSNQTFTVNQSGNKTITLKNDNTVVTPGNGALTIKTAGEGKSATGSFTANQNSGSTITLPTIRYGDLSGRPSIPAAAGNGTITITQPGTSNQTFTVNQSGNTTIALKNDNTNTTYTGGTGIDISGTTINTDSTVARTVINNSFSGRQTFEKASFTDDIRMTGGATLNFFDNSPNLIGGTSVLNHARINWNGGIESTSGGSVFAFNNSQTVQHTGGTNTANVFPSGIKSTPTITNNSFTHYAHFLAQQLGYTDGGEILKGYGFHVCAAAMSGTNTNYALSVTLPEDGTKNYAVYCSGTAPSYFGGNVTSGGTIGFSGRFNVRMEADDPAAYSTTYETELDDELNEIQVAKEEYIGATEDLATMVTSVRSRLTAIESVKIAETESQSSELFNLLADLTSRIEALEAASGGASVATETPKKK